MSPCAGDRLCGEDDLVAERKFSTGLIGLRRAWFALALGTAFASCAWSEEVPKDQMRIAQSRRFPTPITSVFSALKEKLEEAGGKCYITVSYYPPGEGHNTGVGNCNFAIPDKPTMMDKIARGASFIPLVGAALSWGISTKADSQKDKVKDTFISVIRFEAIGDSKEETMLRVRAFTSRQRMVNDDAYYKELFAKLGAATHVEAQELTLQDIDQ